MSFNILAVRSVEDGADGALFPVPVANGPGAGQSGLIRMDASDGPNVVGVLASNVTVYEVGTGFRGTDNTVVQLLNSRIDVYVTDSRVAVACARFDKGGGWVGIGAAGVVAATAANAVSKSRAKARSRGQMLVGHVRYPWLAEVRAHPREGFLSPERLRLTVTDAPSGSPVVRTLDLSLPKDVDSVRMAADIARRAAAHRLAHGVAVPPDDAGLLAAMSEGGVAPTPVDGHSVAFRIPGASYVSAKTAFPASSAGAIPRARPTPDTTPRPQSAGGQGQHCTTCGAPGVRGDSFCQRCGSRVPADATGGTLTHVP
jgi:hypothetical protein